MSRFIGRCYGCGADNVEYDSTPWQEMRASERMEKFHKSEERARILALFSALTAEPVFDVEGNPMDAVSDYELQKLIESLK